MSLHLFESFLPFGERLYCPYTPPVRSSDLPDVLHNLQNAPSQLASYSSLVCSARPIPPFPILYAKVYMQGGEGSSNSCYIPCVAA